MNKSKFISGAILVSIISMTGCSTYIPPNKPQHQVAYISEVQSNKEHGAIVIEKINGVATQDMMERMGLGIISPEVFSKEFWTKRTGSDTYPIESGLCKLDVHLFEGLGEANGEIEFNAEAGKKYRVTSSVHSTGGWFNTQYAIFFVIDEATGLPVSYLPEEYKQEYLKSLKNSNS